MPNINKHSTNTEWKPNLPINGHWEPFELRDLKKKLANIECGCAFCEKFRNVKQPSAFLQQPFKTFKHEVGDPKRDKDVQSIDCQQKDEKFRNVKQPFAFLQQPFKTFKREVGDPKRDKDVQSIDCQQKDVETLSIESSGSAQKDEEVQSVLSQTSSTSQLKNEESETTDETDSVEKLKKTVFLVNNGTFTDDLYFPSEKFPSLKKDDMCPSCYFTLKLLRSGTTKVLKDEEVEIKPEIFACDKSTSKNVLSMEKSTSYNKPLLKYPHTSISDDSFYSHNHNRSIREVTFAFSNRYYGYDDTESRSDASADVDMTSLTPVLGHQHCEEEEVETSSTLFGVTPEIQDLSPPVSQLCRQWIDINQYINLISPPDPGFFTVVNRNHK